MWSSHNAITHTLDVGVLINELVCGPLLVSFDAKTTKLNSQTASSFCRQKRELHDAWVVLLSYSRDRFNTPSQSQHSNRRIGFANKFSFTSQLCPKTRNPYACNLNQLFLYYIHYSKKGPASRFIYLNDAQFSRKVQLNNFMDTDSICVFKCSTKTNQRSIPNDKFLADYISCFYARVV